MLSIFFILQSVFSQNTLYYEAFTTQSFDYQDWQILYNNQASLVYQCGGIQLFGVFDQTNIITNLIKLPPHYLIRIIFDFWKIGTGGDPIVFVDYQKIPVSTSNQQFNKNCQDNHKAIIISIDQIIDHTFNNALIAINTTNGYWGINNFKIYIQECPRGCLVCHRNDRRTEQCITWSLAFKSLYQMNLQDLIITEWAIQSPISTDPLKTDCSNIPMLCGYNKCSQNTTVQLNTIIVKDHSNLKIQFRFFKLDTWDNERAELYIDNSLKWSESYTPEEGYLSICGNGYQDLGENVEINIVHSDHTLNFELKTSLVTVKDQMGIDDESFGLRDVWIFQNNRCDVTYYFDCCGDSIKQVGEECDDGNYIPFDGCHNCQYSCIEKCSQCIFGICVSCEEGWKLIESTQQCEEKQEKYIRMDSDCQMFVNEICRKCEENYYLNIFQNTCESQCGDGIANGMEQCDDGNCVPYDGCYLCRYSCIQGCQNCDKGICLDAILTSQIYNMHYCSPNCLQCFHSQCMSCKDNYYLNLLTHNCDSLCGDGIVNGKEQCDDGNMYPHDNCDKCTYSCPQHCTLCLFGQCQDENNIIQKSIDSQFQECQVCLNNIQRRCHQYVYFDKFKQDCMLFGFSKENFFSYKLTPYEYQYQLFMCDRCKQMQYLQCNEKCSFCTFGECHKCDKGFTLDNNECRSICGDNLVHKDSEECDNPDSQGCINCKIQPQYNCVSEDISICWTCGTYCTQCYKIDNELFCNKCQEGYFPNKLNCEKCETRCITCENQPNQCTSCYRHDCRLCEDTEGLYTDYELKKCISICGDGITVRGLEDCDDGNTDNWDGCNNQCQIETFIDDKDNFEILKDQINNDLKIIISEQITIKCTDISVTIEGFILDEFIFNSTFTNGTCLIKFTFLKTIEKTNLIHLQLRYNLQHSRLLSDEYLQCITITPKKEVILSEIQQEQAEIISSAQSYLFLILLIMAPLSMIFGVFDYFWAVLEILSWINNFYFLNVSFPFNVQILLLNSDWSALVNFPTYQELNKPSSEYFFQSPEKFMEKGTDPLFINNAQVPFAFILFSIFLYFLSLILKFIVNCFDKLLLREEVQKKQNRKLQIFQIKRKFTQTQQTIQNNLNQDDVIIQKIHNSKILWAQKIIIKVSRELYGRMKQTVSLCLLDITLAVTLQIIMASQLHYTIILINQLLAILTITLIFNQLYQQYLLINMHPILAENEEFKQKYGCLYEGYNLESRFGMTYNLIYLIRKVLYIIFTVYFYNNPLFQTTLCFVTSVLGVLLLIYKNPFYSNKQRIIQFIQEGSVSAIVFITIFFAFEDQTNFLGEDLNILFGWIFIAFILLALITEMFVLFYEISKAIILNVYTLYVYLRQKQNKVILKKNAENALKKSKGSPQKVEVQLNQIVQEDQKLRFHGINGILHIQPRRQNL